MEVTLQKIQGFTYTSQALTDKGALQKDLGRFFDHEVVKGISFSNRAPEKQSEYLKQIGNPLYARFVEASKSATVSKEQKVLTLDDFQQALKGAIADQVGNMFEEKIDGEKTAQHILTERYKTPSVGAPQGLATLSVAEAEALVKGMDIKPLPKTSSNRIKIFFALFTAFIFSIGVAMWYFKKSPINIIKSMLGRA